SSSSIGFSIALNSIGWSLPDSFISNVDALIGGPTGSAAFGTNTGAGTHAYIKDSQVSAGGLVSVTATSSEHLTSMVSNAVTTSSGSVLTGASASASAGIVTLNKVSSAARAEILYSASYTGGGTITGGTGVTVS